MTFCFHLLLPHYPQHKSRLTFSPHSRFAWLSHSTHSLLNSLELRPRLRFSTQCAAAIRLLRHQTSFPSAWLPSLPPLVQLRLRPPPLLLLLLSLPPASIPPRLRTTRLVLSRQPSPRRSAVSTSPVVLGLGTFIFHVYIVALADYLTVTSCSRLPPALTSTRSS
jgi:hypothetical protein